MENNPKVSVIVLNFNGMKFLPALLKSLKNQTYSNFEITIIDNSSNDGSRQWIEQLRDVKKILNSINLGFTKAYNQAVSSASGDFIFLLNNDTIMDSQCIEKLVQKLDSREDMGICGCQMRSYDNQKHWHTGIGIDVFGYPIKEGETFYIEGSALMIKKSVWQKLGGFDDKYFMFHEDIDLAWRTWLLGYNVGVCEQAIVRHFIGAAAGGTLNKKYKSTHTRRYLAERNNLRTLLKNYSLSALLLILPVYILINIAEILFFLILFKPKTSFCYIKSWFFNISKIENTSKKRKEIQKNRKIKDSVILKKVSFKVGKLKALKEAGLPNFK